MNNVKIVVEQRKKVIISTSIFVSLAAIANLVGATGHQGGLFLYLVLIFWAMLMTGLFILHFHKNPPIKGMIITYMMSAELMLCAEMIILAYENSDYSKTITLANMTLLAIVMLMSISSYLPKLSSSLALISVVTYTICATLTDTADLWDLHLIFCLIFGLGATFSVMITKGMKKIIDENINYKIVEQNVLTALGLTEVEFAAHVELAKENKTRNKQTLGILDLMGNGARENLKKNVTYLVEQDKIEYDKIADLIPEFTPSEAEIAKLIIEGKKLADIVLILGKKESNITCQRSKMRVKLNLKDRENLRDAIIERVVL